MKSDVWQLGLAIFEMLFGYCPIDSSSFSSFHSLFDNSTLKIKFPSEINPHLKMLISRMLTKNYKLRISW